MSIFMSIFIGLTTGIFGGLVGVGGGAIMITLMVGILKVSQHQAHGTSLVAIIFTGISGAITYYMNGSIDLISSLLLASTAIITARIGAIYANSLPEFVLKRAFGCFILLVTLILLLKPYLTHISVSSTLWLKVTVLLFTGAFTGFLSGMMGIGGGAIMIPVMVILAGFDQYTAQGISLLTMIPISLTGAFTHWRLGNVHADVLPGLIPGILIGTFLGGSLAHLLPEAALRVIFSAVSLYIGIKNIRAPKSIPKAIETRSQ